MSVIKYTSFEKASKDLWVLNPDENYYSRLRNLFEFWGRISKREVDKGIKKIKVRNK